MKVAVVDIGTNSMRLLITDGQVEDGRWVEVTGLGRGVDSTGRLSEDAMERTLTVLGGYGSLMERAGVARRAAIATSASRDASNRVEFFDRAEHALGVRPVLISGGREAILAFDGATSGLDVAGPIVVSDIGGGSTELVSSDSGLSIDIGSVRLTERHLPDRPPTTQGMRRAWSHVRALLADIELGEVATHVGVAGTWTSLAAIAQDLPKYDRERVHGYELPKEQLDRVLGLLSRMTVEETAAIPSLDPNRAPVILAGSVVASIVMEKVGVDETLISVRDTLDGLASELLALP